MRKSTILNKSRTDWQRLDAMKAEDIDLSEIPEVTPEMFAKAIVKRGLKTTRQNKTQLTIRMDKDVLQWFKSQGSGYQTRINALLRAYMEASLRAQKR